MCNFKIGVVSWTFDFRTQAFLVLNSQAFVFMDGLDSYVTRP